MSLCSVALRGAQMAVQSQRGEKWWGVYVGGAPDQPFIQPMTVTTGRSLATGFTAPLLISNMGRYIYCRPGTEVTFDGTTFRLVYGDDQPELAEAGRTLHDAYRVAWLKHFPSQGIAPPQEFYTTLLYDTSTEFGSLPSQSEVTEYAEKLVREGFPTGIILIGDGWSEQPGTYTFFAPAFPDPKGMVDRLHQLGFKVMLTVTPYAAVSGRIYMENMRRGFLLQEPGKGPMVVCHEGGYCSVYDLGDEPQLNYVRGAILRLKSDYGIDGMRFDCSQLLPLLSDAQAARLVGRWVEIGSGMELAEYCPGANSPHTPYANVIASNRTACSNPLISQIDDLAAAAVCGYNGCRFTPCALADTAALLSRQWLMARTLQLQALAPMPTVDFAPWKVTDPKLYDAVKQCLTWRASLEAYMTEARKECVATGEPLFRPMEYAFPRTGFSDCNDQFMLGVRYLCAPFCDGEDHRLVRLPRGVWSDRQGRRLKGPLVVTVKQSDTFCPIFELAAK